MNNKQFNEYRWNRNKQYYRLSLGIQQLLNYPLLNVIWVLFIAGVAFMVKIEKRYVGNIEVYPLFQPIFLICIKVVIIIIPVICGIGMLQFIGFCFAIKDEADMELVFGDKRDTKNQSLILIYKKKDKKSGVVKRQFYSTIPLEQYRDNKEPICDRMNIHLVSDITYGGRKKNKGNFIYFESAKGRKPIERGTLYDDTF